MSKIDIFRVESKKLASEEADSLSWAPSLFKKKLISAGGPLKEFLSEWENLEQEVLNEKEIAQFIWARSLQYQTKLHLPDVLVHPKTRFAAFAHSEKRLKKSLEEGFIPLSPGDLLQYNLFSFLGKETAFSHQSIYVGCHYVVELIRVQASKRKPLARIILRPIDQMFVRRQFQVVKSKGDRLESIRRALSSLAFQQDEYDGISNPVACASLIVTICFAIIIGVLIHWWLLIKKVPKSEIQTCNE